MLILFAGSYISTNRNTFPVLFHIALSPFLRSMDYGHEPLALTYRARRIFGAL